LGGRSGGLVWLRRLSSLLSNLMSHLAAVLLLAGVVPQGSTKLWLALAASSTLAGNATILGAACNVIVVQAASRDGVTVTMKDFMKAGLPVTAATLFLSTLLIALLVPAGEQDLCRSGRLTWPHGTGRQFPGRAGPHGGPARPLGLPQGCGSPSRLSRGPPRGIRPSGGPSRGLPGRPAADRIRPDDLRALDDRDHARGGPSQAGGARARDRDGLRVSCGPPRVPRRPEERHHGGAEPVARGVGTIEPGRRRLRGRDGGRRRWEPRPSGSGPLRLHHRHGGSAADPGCMAGPACSRRPDCGADWFFSARPGPRRGHAAIGRHARDPGGNAVRLCPARRGAGLA